MNNFCQKCGSVIHAGDKFCEHCGNPVGRLNTTNMNSVSNFSNQRLNQVNGEVNNIFSYSKEVAKSNGNSASFALPIVILFIYFVFIIWLILSETKESLITTLINFAFLFGIVYSIALVYIRKKAKTIAFATTNDGKIYRAAALNGSGLYINKVSINEFSDDLKNSLNFVGILTGSALAPFFAILSLNRSAKYMANPKVVKILVDNAQEVTGAQMMEILKVHSIQVGRHSIKIKCDYNFCNAQMSSNKQVTNATVRIDKSYANLDYLLKLLETHQNY